MIDKPKTIIEELLKTPRNGKYLKVVAREDFFMKQSSNISSKFAIF